MSGFRHLGDTPVHQGYIWRVAVAEFEAPDGSRFERDVVRSPGAVAAAPLRWRDGVPWLTFVRQYRAPFDDLVLEIPAGMRDIPDEPTELTAARELVEEVGLAATELHPLVKFYPAVGMTDAVLHVFVATGLEEVDRQTHGPEEDHMDVVEMPLAEAVQRLMAGEIHDAKTVIAILMVERLVASGQLSG